ncbi:hypothetical protein OUZ56_016007 [Daphnia magna]|uniref:Uncharacterized protein n=1 Tax=Daphnia magna TaxID=35525 RepID=A0ABR0APD6_9CRUS|nr:hypothetical protein OUZ56_016007 [Daphnia magna]
MHLICSDSRWETEWDGPMDQSVEKTVGFDAALYRSIIHSEMFHKLAGIKLPIRECLKPPPE